MTEESLYKLSFIQNLTLMHGGRKRGEEQMMLPGLHEAFITVIVRMFTPVRLNTQP